MCIRDSYTKNAKYTYDMKLEDIEQVTSDIDVSPLYEALSTLKSPYREIIPVSYTHLRSKER